MCDRECVRVLAWVFVVLFGKKKTCTFNQSFSLSTLPLGSRRRRDCRNRLNVERAHACTHFDLHCVKERGSLRLKAPRCLTHVRILYKEPGK